MIVSMHMSSSCFVETFKVLQRSLNDPMNHWDPDKKIWSRYFIDGSRSGIVKCFENNSKIHVEQETGDLTEEFIIDQFQSLLGLDCKPIDNFSDLIKAKGLSGSLGDFYLPGYASLFEAVIQTILGQLVSANAANTIRCKFINKYGKNHLYKGIRYYDFPTAEQICNLSPEVTDRIDKLKLLGMTRSKASAITHIATNMADERWLSELKGASTENARQLLTSISGIGNWTADWVLLRGLRFFDVVPSSDLVVRKAMSWYWSQNSRLRAEDIEQRISLDKTLCKETKGLFAFKVMFIYIACDLSSYKKEMIDKSLLKTGGKRVSRDVNVDAKSSKAKRLK